MNILQNKHNALIHKGITIKCPPNYHRIVLPLFYFFTLDLLSLLAIVMPAGSKRVLWVRSLAGPIEKL